MAMLDVTTESGKLHGTYSACQGVSVFKGVPYAAPPVGPLRWREPQPVEPWTGVRNALEFAPIALQIEKGCGDFLQPELFPTPLPSSEDCLYLDIWTPAVHPDEKLPVAVWYPGGGFQIGCAHMQLTEGEAFAQRGIVTVAVTHRLNICGFLPHRELDAESPRGISGNFGLQDIIASLKWVKRNIAAFGGDPAHISIFGHSAGGRTICLLSAIPETDGDFVSAAIETGGGVSVKQRTTHIDKQTAYDRGEQLLRKAGVKSITEAREMLTSKQIVELQRWAIAEFRDRAPFRPVVDGVILPDDFNTLAVSGRLHDVQYLIGCASHEDDPPRHPRELDLGVYWKNAEEIYGSQAEEFLRIAGADTVEGALNTQKVAFGESDMAGCLAFCALQNLFGRRPAYRYYFSQIPPGSPGIGAYHGALHPYVFHTLNRSWRPFTGVDYDVSNRMCDCWANFFKNGNPNGENVSPEWIPHTEALPLAMEFGNSNAMMHSPASEMVLFQRDFFVNKARALLKK